jgi:hypothetical protein
LHQLLHMFWRLVRGSGITLTVLDPRSVSV